MSSAGQKVEPICFLPRHADLQAATESLPAKSLLAKSLLAKIQPTRLQAAKLCAAKLGTARFAETAGMVLVLVVAALARFWALGRPNTLVFDETYYVKDAYTLWQVGFEARWPPEIDAAFAAGDVNSFLPEAAFVVHPQVGKWLIALGMMLGGATNSWAWRLSSALVGVLAVWLVIRISRRLFSSPTIGLIAGVLMAIDGVAIVHSRVALLDQFLMIFVLAAFYCLLHDREQLTNHLNSSAFTKGTFRWWRLLAGVLLGLACGVKWSAAYFVAGFGVLTVLSDLNLYWQLGRKAGISFGAWGRRWAKGALGAFRDIVPVAIGVYVASWFSWFATPGAWGRDWAVRNPAAGLTWLPPALRSWIHYHQQIWTFHIGLDAPHPYATSAWTWLLQIRPTAFYWGNEADLASYPPCRALAQCTMTINSLGNPILWWLATFAIVVTIWSGVAFRDWRALAALSGILFGWAPWLLYPERTTFAYYAIVFLPWMIFTLCYLFRLMRNWRAGRIAVPLVVAVMVGISIAFYPIWTAMPIERAHWNSLMWLTTWI